MQSEPAAPAVAAGLPSTRDPAAPWGTLLTLRAFYFFFFGAVGCYLAFFAPYLRGRAHERQEEERGQPEQGAPP